MKQAPTINQQFWDNLFTQGTMPWDAKTTPQELKAYLEKALSGRQSVFIPGCGAAYELSSFIQYGHDVIAMDYSQQAVKMAQSMLGKHKDKVVLGDVFNADSTHSFDVIYERAFLAALPRDQWPDYFAMVDKLLPRDGLLIGYFVIDDNYHSRFPPFCLRSGELEGYLEPAFKLVESSVVANSVEVFKGRERWIVWQKSCRI